MTFKAVILEGGRYEEVWIEKYRSKGVKPFHEPLPYYMKSAKVSCPFVTNAPEWDIGDEQPQIRADVYKAMDPEYYLSTNEHNAVHNKALNKLADKLEYVKNLYEAWHERREAYAMLGQSIRAIHTFVKSWKDPRYWKRMRKAFKTNIKDPTSLPQAWLLWNFALKPLIATVEDTAELLSQDFPVSWVDASSGTSGTYRYNEYWEEAGNDIDNRGYDVLVDYTYIVKHGVLVTALNPNAQLLNILGATTPLSTAFSVLPWGWAVNYFFNVSDMISNIEVRFPGVDLGSSYTTVFSRSEANGSFHAPSVKDPYVVVWNDQLGIWDFEKNPSLAVVITGECATMNRSVSTSAPSYRPEFSYPALGSTSFANLASAIALTLHGADQELKRANARK